MHRLKLIAYLIFILLLSSCRNDESNIHNDILVKVNNRVLYKSELDSVMVKSLSAEDSVLFVRKMTHDWVKDQLLYDKAIENIQDNEWIESEVERFRKELILSRYESDLMQENIQYSEIPDEECEEFYNRNKRQFILSGPIIKGIYVKIPADAPRLKDIKKKMTDINEESLDMIEKYSLQNAITYEYFMEKWVSFEDISKKIPVEADIIKILKSKKSFETTYDNYWYFIFVTSLLNKNDFEPFEVSKPRIKEILNYTKKKDFIFNLKNELLENALSKKQLIFYDESLNFAEENSIKK